jgi:hypothetical protein
MGCQKTLETGNFKPTKETLVNSISEIEGIDLVNQTWFPVQTALMRSLGSKRAFNGIKTARNNPGPKH